MIRPEIILGPPGTGKTTTLLGITDDELIAATPPNRIAYLSFTRRAAQEAIDRAVKLFGVPSKEFPWFRTIHSLCFRYMGLSSGVVLEGKRLEEFANVVKEELTGNFSYEDGTYYGYTPGDRMLFIDNLARVRGIALKEQYNADYDDLEWYRLERFSAALAQFKLDRGLIDYTDMLEAFASGPSSPEIDVVIVDEAQDLSRLQWKVISKLSAGARRLVVAGDDDQAIYRWAGADVDYFINLEGSTRVLHQSYRVPKLVQDLALEIVERVTQRRPKTWAPRDDSGSVAFLRKVDDVDWDDGDDILVLARNAKKLREVQRSLHSAGRLYEFRGMASVKPKTLKAIVNWEQLRQGKHITKAEAVSMYQHMSPRKEIKWGHATLPDIHDDELVDMEMLRNRGGLLVDSIWHEVLSKIPHAEIAYIIRCRRKGEKLSRGARIRLSTIHSAKGAEADRVVLITDMATRTREEMRLQPDDEHRTWYVAVTRAKRRLEIIAPTGGNFYAL